MKINIKKFPNVRVGDLVVNEYDGASYLVSNVAGESNKFTLYSIKNSVCLIQKYDSIDDMLKNLFVSYIHYPKEKLELLVDGGNK